MESTQIFISYRRATEAASIAVLLKDILTFHGYRVFLDTGDNTRTGNWKTALRNAMQSASDVIVLVSPGALERCADPDDAVRWEIETALDKYAAAEGKNVHVIPVFWDTPDYKGSSPHSVKTPLPEKVLRLFDINGVPFRGGIGDLPGMYNAVLAKLCSRPNAIVQEAYDPPPSTHRSDYKKEVKRLHLQEQFSRELDQKLLKRAIAMTGKKQGLTALDIGCADGFVTEQRLTARRGFHRVTGIDFNEAVVHKARARAQEKPGIYSYHQVNVEASNFIPTLCAAMEEDGVASYDIIYSAFTLHHLNQPVALLEKLNDLLSPGGVIVLRGVDDDAQLSYVYKKNGAIDTVRSNLVRDITRLSVQTQGMSNRFHGRQMYSWLRQAGYTDISTEYDVIDTVGMDDDEREALYNYYFSFRSDYTERAMENDPGNARKEQIHAQMAARLASLKKTFLDDDNMYYMVLSFGIIARKHG